MDKKTFQRWLKIFLFIVIAEGLAIPSAVTAIGFVIACFVSNYLAEDKQKVKDDLLIKLVNNGISDGREKIINRYIFQLSPEEISEVLQIEAKLYKIQQEDRAEMSLRNTDASALPSLDGAKEVEMD